MTVCGGTAFPRCSETVANPRLDIVQCVVDRVAEKRKRRIFICHGRVASGSTVAEDRLSMGLA